MKWQRNGAISKAWRQKRKRHQLAWHQRLWQRISNGSQRRRWRRNQLIWRNGENVWRGIRKASEENNQRG